MVIGVDLFAGAGGMSLGAVQAGIDVKIAVEKDLWAVQTYKANFPDCTLLHADIRDVDNLMLPARKAPLVLFGGPPCRGYSTSNQRTRNTENPSNWLFKEFLRLAGLLQPDWVVLENVAGILETEKGAFLHSMLDSFGRMGYGVSCEVLDAASHCVPQFRKRVFIIGCIGSSYRFVDRSCTTKRVTVAQAISDLPDLPNGASFPTLPYKSRATSEYAHKMRGDLMSCSGHYVTKNANYVLERYKHIPQGGNWTNIPIHLMQNYKNPRKCHTGIYYRLRNDEPSKVIGNFRKNMLIHPTQDRGLSIREAARLQSFPDWYVFVGSIGFQQQQVGDAVPPLLAEAVFRSILQVSAN